jgi:hypothetical protein
MFASGKRVEHRIAAKHKNENGTTINFTRFASGYSTRASSQLARSP